jgi:hypothetical protein
VTPTDTAAAPAATCPECGAPATDSHGTWHPSGTLGTCYVYACGAVRCACPPVAELRAAAADAAHVAAVASDGLAPWDTDGRAAAADAWDAAADLTAAATLAEDPDDAGSAP